MEHITWTFEAIEGLIGWFNILCAIYLNGKGKYQQAIFALMLGIFYVYLSGGL